jgi:hypothetical protein
MTEPDYRKKLKKLNPSTIKKLAGCIRKGLSAEKSCQLINISPTTLSNWKAAATHSLKLMESGQPMQPRDWLLCDFWYSIQKAEAAFEDEQVKKIHECGHGGQLVKMTTATRTLRNGDTITNEEATYKAPEWQALAWLLERKYPKRYGRNLTLDGEVRKVKAYVGFDPAKWEEMHEQSSPPEQGGNGHKGNGHKDVL